MRFDLHIHSHFSPDSNSSVEAILKQALEVGLDGLAITDHNSVQSFFDAVRLTEDLGLNLIIVPGAEISTTEGHLITLGNHTLVPPVYLLLKPANALTTAMGSSWRLIHSNYSEMASAIYATRG